MKVYIVSEYDDELMEIKGVFSDEDKAKRFNAVQRYECEIVEAEIDSEFYQVDESKLLKLWKVKYENGVIVDSEWEYTTKKTEITALYDRFAREYIVKATFPLSSPKETVTAYMNAYFAWWKHYADAGEEPTEEDKVAFSSGAFISKYFDYKPFVLFGVGANENA